MAFPATRLRRLRQTGVLRSLVARPSSRSRISSIRCSWSRTARAARRSRNAGIDHLSIDGAVEEAGIAASLGIPAVLLFGLPASKDPEGSGAWHDEGVIQLATRAIKSAHPDLLVITDLCLCEYTSHGHCGVLRPDGVVDNDQTLELLARTAVSQAAAGADAVAPSDMMDGRVGALRAALDERGLSETPPDPPTAPSTPPPFMARSASLPTPRPVSGDRKAYQMDPANALEAVREAQLDADEGADIVMVKPALPYLDIIRRVKDAAGDARSPPTTSAASTR